MANGVKLVNIRLLMKIYIHTETTSNSAQCDSMNSYSRLELK